MSDRLTPLWTENIEDAYGDTGAKGRQGELFVIKVIVSWGWEVVYYNQHKTYQLQGKDIAFRKPGWSRFYTADVKNNMWENGSFMVDTTRHGWLFDDDKISDRIWHVNTDTGRMAWYDRQYMQQYIRHYQLTGGDMHVIRWKQDPKISWKQIQLR